MSLALLPLAFLVQGSITVASETKVLSPAPVPNGAFGRTVALRGDDAVLQDGYGTPVARVFRRSGGAWSHVSDLPAQPSAGSDEIDVDGEWMVVGQGWYGLTGSAWVYRRVASAWQYFQELPMPLSFNLVQHYGLAVDIEGERIAIGNPTDTHYSGGAVYVWEYSAALAQWRIRATARSPGPTQQGAGVALFGDDLLVASRGDVRYYRYDPNAVAWNLQGTVTALTPGGGFNSPSSRPMEISRDGVAIVGDRYDSTFGASAGAAHVLEKIGDAWRHAAALYPGTPLADGRFGDAVAARGSVLAVGAPGTFGVGNGTVELFRRNGGWQRAAVVQASDGVLEDYFGFSVDIDESSGPLHSTLVVGAPGQDAGAPFGGAVYVYELDSVAATVYCSSKLNSLGCVPRVGFTGMPSASAPGAFTITATDVLNQKNGVFFYGTSGRSFAPFQGGFKCVRSPTRRTGTLFSGGSASGSDCSGALTLDLNAWIQSGADPSLVAGAVVDAQFWYRDGAASFGTGLSEAIELVIQP